MKNQINIRSAKEIYSMWDDDVCFKELTPTPKVISVLEVFDEITLATLSPHHDYLAVMSGTQAEKEVLVIIYLNEKRAEAFKSFPYSVCVIYFIPDCEKLLLVGSSCGRIFRFNIGTKRSHILEGHHNPPLHISYRPNCDLLITWNFTEVLLWSWPDCLLTRRLKIDQNGLVIEAGHICEKSYIFAAFDSGIILSWDQKQNMKEYAIKPPDGFTMEFKSFSLSLDGDWIIGVGSQPFVVFYSVVSLRVVHTIHLASPHTVLGMEQVQFLPCIHPQFVKTFLVRTLDRVIVVDFINFAIIKVIKSPNESIRNVCISTDGFLLAIVYSSGSTKLYTLPSFFPKSVSTLNLKEENVEVGFNLLKLECDEKEKNKGKAVKFFLEDGKWKDILVEFEEFPSKYRKHIWAGLLKLPQNYSVLNEILRKDKRYKFAPLKKEFHQLSSSTLEVLKSTLECLYYWSPFLAGTEILPYFVLPFVEFFESNHLLCFEATLTIVLNWCRFWFRNWPQPPEMILSLVDQLVCEHDADLWIHLREIGVSVERTAWALLTSAFRVVFTRKDWLIIWDHILSQYPSFMICVCAAFILSLRQTLLHCFQESPAQELFCQETWVPIRTIVKRAKKLQNSLKLKENIKEEMEKLKFLPKGDLLPFDIGPEIGLLCQANEDFTATTTTPSVIYLKTVVGAEKKTFHSSSLKHRTITVSDDELSSRDYFPSDVAVMDSVQFNQLEKTCLRNIQCTRKKLISRIE